MHEIPNEAVLLKRVPAHSNFIISVDKDTKHTVFRKAVIHIDQLEEDGVSCYVKDFFKNGDSPADVVDSAEPFPPSDGSAGTHFVVSITAGEVRAAGATVEFTPYNNHGEPHKLDYTHADIRCRKESGEVGEVRAILVSQLILEIGEAHWVLSNDKELAEKSGGKGS